MRTSTALLTPVLMLGIAAALGVAARDPVVDEVVVGLEDRFGVSIAVASVGLSPLSALPDVSVALQDVVATSTTGRAGLAVLEAEEVVLGLTLESLWGVGPIDVRSVEIRGGALRLGEGERGTGKEAGAAQATRPVALNLDRLSVERVDLSYENRRMVERIDAADLTLVVTTRDLGGEPRLVATAQSPDVRLSSGGYAVLDGVPVDLLVSGAGTSGVVEATVAGMLGDGTVQLSDGAPASLRLTLPAGAVPAARQRSALSAEMVVVEITGGLDRPTVKLSAP